MGWMEEEIEAAARQLEAEGKLIRKIDPDTGEEIWALTEKGMASDPISDLD